MEAVVLDASAEMARRALDRGVPSVEARSQRMPFEEGSFRFCQFHLSIHHEGWRRSVAEAARVVASGGVVGVWTFGHDYLRASFLSRWFPSAARIDVERFPAVDEVAAELRAAGLAVEGPAWEVEERVWPAGGWEQAVRDGFISTLHLLEPEEVRLGLEAFRRAHPDPGERVAYDLPFVWVAGRRR